MKKTSLSTSDQEWMKKLGRHVERLIREKGYETIYDFWINKAGDHVSRASLNNLITGKKDFRISTFRKVAKLLGVRVPTLFDFD